MLFPSTPTLFSFNFKLVSVKHLPEMQTDRVVGVRKNRKFVLPRPSFLLIAISCTLLQMFALRNIFVEQMRGQITLMEYGYLDWRAWNIDWEGETYFNWVCSVTISYTQIILVCKYYWVLRQFSIRKISKKPLKYYNKKFSQCLLVTVKNCQARQ